jgi:DNA-binding FadR family transcriptional regulator
MEHTEEATPGEVRSSEGLGAVAENDELLEVGRKAVEEALIEWRDARLSEPVRRNGLIVREKDGTPSDVIRFGPETALRIGLRAIAAHLAVAEKCARC